MTGASRRRRPLARSLADAIEELEREGVVDPEGLAALDARSRAAVLRGLDLAASLGGRPYPGERLGPYRLLRKLGEGAAGIVYAGIRERGGDDEGRVVALKVLRAELRTSATATARFVRELRAGKRVRHANLVRARHGFVVPTVTGPRWVVVFDFAPGRSLLAHLKEEGPLAEGELRAVADQALRALEALHGAGILHRDVKPEHLVVDARGHVRLVDLGLARLAHGSRITGSGEILGTPAFLAPEVVAGDIGRAGPRTDLYGLGATIFFLATGRPPVPADAATAEAVRGLGPPDVRLRRPDLSPEFAAWLDDLLAPRPAERPASAASARRALTRLPRVRRRTARPPPLVVESDAFLPWVADALRGERRAVLVRTDRRTRETVRAALDDLRRRCAAPGAPIVLRTVDLAPRDAVPSRVSRARGNAAPVAGWLLEGIGRARDDAPALDRIRAGLAGGAALVLATFGPRVPRFVERLLGDPRVALLDVPLLLRHRRRPSR